MWDVLRRPPSRKEAEGPSPPLHDVGHPRQHQPRRLSDPSAPLSQIESRFASIERRMAEVEAENRALRHVVMSIGAGGGGDRGGPATVTSPSADVSERLLALERIVARDVQRVDALVRGVSDVQKRAAGASEASEAHRGLEQCVDRCRCVCLCHTRLLHTLCTYLWASTHYATLLLPRVCVAGGAGVWRRSRARPLSCSPRC